VTLNASRIAKDEGRVEGAGHQVGREGGREGGKEDRVTLNASCIAKTKTELKAQAIR